MENNRFFKTLWRANAVILFVAGIGLVILLLMFAALLLSDFRESDAPPPPVVSASSNQSSEKEVFTLRRPSNYRKTLGADFTYFELRTGTESSGSLSKGSSSQLRNIGVYDLKTDKTHWVFPDPQQEIEVFKSVGKTLNAGSSEEKATRTGFVLTLAKSVDSETVVRDIWVMSPDGKDVRKLLSDVTQAPDIETYGNNQVKLFIEAKTHIDVYPFDVDRLTVGEPTRVSIP